MGCPAESRLGRAPFPISSSPMGFLLLTLTSSLVFVIYSKSFSCDDALKKWKKVVATFGEEILLENGEVNRPMLGQIVFSDPDKRQFLDRLLAPHISSGIFWEVVKLWLKGYKVIVLDVPLLFEAKIDKFTKPTIVVWIDPETQKKRLMGRDKSNEENARNRINAQMTLDLKRNKADMVTDNIGSLE